MSEFLGFKSYPLPYFCPHCEETYEEDDKVYHEHCEEDEQSIITEDRKTN
jgi:hypothetical protein